MCVDAHAVVLVWSLRSMLGGFPGQAPPSGFLRQEDFLANLKSISLMRLDGIDLWSSTYLISGTLGLLHGFWGLKSGPPSSTSRHFTL